MKIGAQLYTVRNYTQNLEDFSETLKKVADIGYTTVQVSGTCAYEADWLKEQLDKTGLAVSSPIPTKNALPMTQMQSLRTIRSLGADILASVPFQGRYGETLQRWKHFGSFTRNRQKKSGLPA